MSLNLPDRLFVTVADMAAALNVHERTFRATLKELQNDTGFPRPSPHCKRPLMFHRESVERWWRNLTQDDVEAELAAAINGQGPDSNVVKLNG